jgi:hypothetical protein
VTNHFEIPAQAGGFFPLAKFTANAILPRRIYFGRIKIFYDAVVRRESFLCFAAQFVSCVLAENVK